MTSASGNLASNCPTTEDRLGPSLSFVSATLILFEYSLTLFDELRFVWSQRRSASTFLFFVARYAGLASAIVTLVQTPTTYMLLAHLSAALRIVIIVAAEAILTLRTWAIWEKKKRILFILGVAGLAALGGNLSVVFRGLNDTGVENAGPDCTAILNSQPASAVMIPYVVVIAYEILTMLLSATRILRWRNQIAPSARTALLDTLWRDGLLHFSWMIVLGIVNVLIIFHGSSAVHTGGSQLQTSIHSVIASRIILHLAMLPRSRDDAQTDAPASTMLFTPTTFQLTVEDSASGDGSYLG
ncbi:hypothetical protein DFH07DRAFT_789842 [Mycena maculata]|uniref:DUF6533 domain-containing protein n=1 Tax=Mycena maculata TaxID=230809 RepID=A0AAD7KEJ3_9AGAR|nr:hypothetical protein DFH07DRAFT_789842 [Mycena maculata]